MLFWLLAAPAALAQEGRQSSDALNRVYACFGVAQDAERLACFETSVRGLQEAERDSFGFNIPGLGTPAPASSGEDAAGLKDLLMIVERVVERSSGVRAFVMTNGQTWVQTERQRAGEVRAGDTVTVRRAALGSFLLSPARGGAAHRVRREG
jgi:hypothetical protein